MFWDGRWRHGGGCRDARARGTPRRGGRDDPAPGVTDVWRGRAGCPALRHRWRALLSLRSNGYINIISPATCPATDILMTRCGARAAPGRDTHGGRRGRGPRLELAGHGTAHSGGARGTFGGGQSPWSEAEDSACFQPW